jgi:O-antigen/teichoic acid export membrane protein
VAAFSSISRWVHDHPVRAGTMAGWFQQGISVTTGLLLVPLVLSLFPLAESGLWFGFQAMVAMVGFLDFGIGAVVARQAAHIRGGGTVHAGDDFLDFGSGDRALHSLSDHAASIYRVTAVLLLLAGILIYELVIPRTRFLEGVAIDSRPVWYIMLLVPLSMLMSNRAASLLVGTGHLFIARLLLALFFLIQGIGVALAAWLTRDLMVMAVVSAAVAALYGIAVRQAYRNLAGKDDPGDPGPVESRKIRGILKVAAPMGVVSVSSFMFASIQVPLVGALLGPAVVAPFYLAQRIGQAGMTAVLQMFQPQLPRFTRMISANDTRGAWAMLRRNLLLGYPATFLVAAAFVVVSPWIAALIAKGNAFPSHSTLMLMGLDYAICTCAVISNQFIIASGRNPFAIPTLAAGALNVALLFLLVPAWGIAGVPVTSLVAGTLAAHWFALLQLARLRRGLLKPYRPVVAI